MTCVTLGVGSVCTLWGGRMGVRRLHVCVSGVGAESPRIQLQLQYPPARSSRWSSMSGFGAFTTPRDDDWYPGTDGYDGDGQGPQNRPEALMSAPQAKKILA